MNLVGRDSELRRLEEARAPCLVYVEGAAGMGKSALIGEWLRTARTAGTVLRSACPAVESPLPLAPIVPLLRQAIEAQGKAKNPLFGALRPLVPELADKLPSAPPGVGGSDAERLRVFRAVTRLLGDLGPAVVVIEDAQWIDDESRDLLRLLLAEPPPRLRLVLTYRPEELTRPGRPLGRAGTSQPELGFHVVALGPLTREQVGDDKLFEASGGVPRVFTDIREHGTSVWLRELVLNRHDTLPEDARAIAQAAAVFRTPATEEELAIVADLPPERARLGLVAALQKGVLTEVRTGLHGYAIGLARKVICEALLAATCRAMHRRAAELPDRSHAQLAYHLRESGQRSAFLEEAEAAAQEAVVTGDTGTAIELLEEALAEPAAPEETRTRLALELARIAVIAVGSGQIEPLLRKILADRQLATTTRGEIRLDLGLVLSNQIGDPTRGLAEIRRATTELEDAPALAARAFCALAAPYISFGVLDDHLVWLERAEEAARRGGDPTIDLVVAFSRAQTSVLLGDPDVADDLVRRYASTTDLSLGERQQLARGLLNLADITTWTGLNDLAEAYLQDGMDLAGETGALFNANTGLGTSLRLDWARGRWEGLAERARDFTAQDPTSWAMIAEGHLVMGQLALARGDWEQAVRSLHDAGLSNPDNVAVPVIIAAAAARIRVRLALGDIDAALADASRIMERLRGKGIWSWAGNAIAIVACAYGRADRIDTAESVVKEFASELGSLAAPAAGAGLTLARGVVAEHGPSPETAAPLYAAAAEAYNALGQPYDAALATEGRVRVSETPDVPALIQALETFTNLGATSDAARCRGVLREQGVAPPDARLGRPGYGDRLSPREREVATLAAAGRTNKEIAAALFLSPRTVEQHVAGALRKLGLKSRTELSTALL